MGFARRHPISALLLVIVLLGLGLRVWYAAEALRLGRFVDEKYSFLNIRAIVCDGTLQPASSYYPYPLFNVPPAALVAGSQALHRWTGDPRFEAVKEKGYGPAAFLLTRLVQTLYGALALWLTYLIGRELFSRQAGLIGALALAFMPWHIHASGYFKPDAQLVAMVLLAFYWSIRAVAEPVWRRYLLAGIGIAMAMSTKMTGGVIAIPLVIGTLIDGWRDRRQVGLLVLSGAVSAGLFALLNPFWRFYPVWLGGLEVDYAMRAARQGMTRWQVPGRVAKLIVDPYTLGPWLGVLALAAFFVLALRLIRARGEGHPGRTPGWMFVSFPLAYTLAYAWKTPYFKDNNFLPVIPFFCLATGWAVTELWKRAEDSWPRLAWKPARLAAILMLVLVITPSGLVYAYRTTTPSTMDRALVFLDRKFRPSTGRLVLVTETPSHRPIWEGGRRFGRGRSRIESVDDWSLVPERRLRLADATVARPNEVGSDLTDRFDQGSTRLFESRWFRQRGPALVATLHDWQPEGRSTTLPIRGCRPYRRCMAADLPAETGDVEWITLVVSLGFGRGESVEDVHQIRVGERQVPLMLASRTERSAFFVTEKFTPATATEVAVFEARKELLRRRGFRIELHRWRRAEED